MFLGDPDMQGVESMTREETVIRLVARTRPGEQFRVAREMRRRIRERLDRMDVGTHEPTASTPPANEPPVASRTRRPRSRRHSIARTASSTARCSVGNT